MNTTAIIENPRPLEQKKTQKLIFLPTFCSATAKQLHSKEKNPGKFRNPDLLEITFEDGCQTSKNSGWA